MERISTRSGQQLIDNGGVRIRAQNYKLKVALHSKSGVIASALGWMTAGYESVTIDGVLRARRTAGALFLTMIAYGSAIAIGHTVGESTFLPVFYLSMLALLLCGAALRAAVPIGFVADAIVGVNAALLFGILLATGGAAVSILIGIPVIVPTLAMVVGNRGSVLVWSGLAVAVITLVILLLALGFEFPIRISTGGATTTRLVMTIVMVVVVCGVDSVLREDRHRAEQQLRESEQLFRQAAEMAKLGHYLWDELAGGCIYASEEYARVLGLTVDKVLKHHITRNRYLELTHPDDRKRIRAAYLENFKQGGRLDIQYRVIRPDGEVRHVHETGDPVVDHRSRFVRTVGILQDITEQKTVLAALEESETLFAQAARTAKLGHASFDADWEYYETVSEEFARIFGYTADEFLQRYRRLEDDIELTHPEDRQRVTRAYEKGGDIDIEFRIVHRDGSVRVVHELVSQATQAANKSGGFNCTLQDITELRQVEHELRAARDVAETANRAKSAFLANMSHEFRTPLNAISGYSELLQKEIGEVTQEVVIADLKKINAAAAHMVSLVTDVLDLSKIESGKTNIHITTFDVKELMDGVVATCGQLTEQNRNRLELRCPNDIGEMRSDMTKMNQLLFNLLSNAAKFTTDGIIEVSARRDDSTGIDMIVVKVRDTGIGITAEQAETVFDAFVQVEQSAISGKTGTGLGLAIAREYSYLLGGQLDVSSEPGKGSVFTATLQADISIAWLEKQK